MAPGWGARIWDRVDQWSVSLAGKCFRWGLHWLYLRHLLRSVTSLDGSTPKKASGQITLLALSPNQFRGDLEVLADSGEFRVLVLPRIWHARPVEWLIPAHIREGSGPEGYLNSADPDYVKARNKLRRRLRGVLRVFYQRLGVDCVIGAGIKYRQDHDWGVASREIGVPYVVFHRENFAVEPPHQEYFRRKVRGLTFEGSHIIVHNEIVRRLFIEEGYVEESRISALGCLRMDSYLRRCRAESHVEKEQVTFFSFSRLAGLYGTIPLDSDVSTPGLATFCEQTHRAVAELAHELPHVHFVVKLKHDRWLKEVKTLLSGCGPITSVRNLQIMVDGNAHDLILSSNVVIAYGSTTLLEAAVAGRPVIYPIFGEALLPEFQDSVHFSEHLDLFEVADSPNNIKSLVKDHLKSPRTDPDRRRLLDRLFETYISSLDADATDKYAGELKRIVGKDLP